MTNARSYKAAISREEAISEIKSCAGTQFDPQLARAFVQIMNGESSEAQTTESMGTRYQLPDS